MISKEDQEVWRAMEGLQAAGKVRFLGVSNVSVEQLRELFVFAKVKPRFAQIRTYASRAWEKPTLAYCAANGIRYQGFSLLTANREQLGSEVVAEIGRRRGLEPSQVLFCFARQLGMIPLTGTSSAEHMRLDLASLSHTLDAADIAALERLGSV